MTLRGVLDVVLSDPGLARVVEQAGAADLTVTAPPSVQPLVAAALAAQSPGAGVPVLVVTAGERDADRTADLAPGRYGLLEPVGPRLPPEELGLADVVVVPALAVGRDGSRLGRGGGFYDRALLHARADAVLVGVVFDEELVDAVPTEAHDVGLHAVVTPSGGWLDLG